MCVLAGMGLVNTFRSYNMLYGIFIKVDKYAADGWSLFIEKPEDDGTYWCDDVDGYHLAQTFEFNVAQHNEWLATNGLKMVEQEAGNIEASYIKAKAQLAELQAKFLMVSHQPTE